MAQQNFKFSIQTTKWGNRKIKNIKANSLDDAKKKLLAGFNKPELTAISLIPNSIPVSEDLRDYYKSVNPITNFDFDYEGEFYLNYINKL